MIKNVLVTGAAGYIGSMSVKLLRLKGYTPVCVDNMQTGFKELLAGEEIHVIDTSDRAALGKIFDEYKPVAVMHFAASSLVEPSVKDPLGNYNNNLGGTLGLIEALIKSSCRALVFSSTAALFGNAKEVPIKEDAPIEPINPYGASKAMDERILDDCSKAYGFHYTSLRYFNVVGADPQLTTGEAHFPGTHILPLIFYRAVTGQEVLIYGDDYNTPDGTCIRDYVHVYDIAEAHILAMERMLEGAGSVKINLGSSRGFSVKEVVELSREITGINFSIRVAPRRPGDPDILVTDNTKAQEYLGWNLKYPSIQDSILHAWQWFKKFHHERFFKGNDKSSKG